jgi:hypothetical protein
MPRQSHYSWLNTRILFCKKVTSLSYSLFSLVHSPVNLCLVGPNILLSTLLWNTLSLLFYLNVRDQVSYPYNSLVHSPVNLSLVGPNILFSTVFWNTFSLRFNLNASDQLSYPYKTTDKITAQFLVIKPSYHENYQSLYLHYCSNSCSRTIKYKAPNAQCVLMVLFTKF